MLRVLAALSTFGLFVLGQPLRADEKPQDVLARAIKAHGGAEVLAKNKAGTTSAKGKMTIPGVGDVEFTQESSHMLPDKLKETVQMQIMGQNISVLTLINGDKLIVEVNGKPVDLDDATKDTLKETGHLLKLGKLVGLATDKNCELSLIGEEKVEDKPAIGIRVVMKGKKDVNLYFDKKTNLLVKLEYRSVDPFTKNEVNEERIISEYTKYKDELPAPKKVIIKHDGKVFLEIETTDVQYLEKIDDGEFKKQ